MKEKKELMEYVNKLVDCFECIQDANKDITVKKTIDEVIDVTYWLAEEE